MVVGTGFASSFFLLGYLKKAPADSRVLVIERGAMPENGNMPDSARRGEGQEQSTFSENAYIRRSGDLSKSWIFSLGFGGGSKCWWGSTPRFLPADFKMQSSFGVGRDWPLSYDDLAPYYDQVEITMSISGPGEPWPFPRNGPYPQPPHRMNDPERLLKAAYPDSFYNVPTSRARVSIEGRNVCCANGICDSCPVNAKFTVMNGLMSVYEDPRVTVLLNAEAIGVDVVNRTARSVEIALGGVQKSVPADLVVLGANALFNPLILQRSSLDHTLLGKGVNEQVGVKADVYLDGVESFQGSTSVTGHSYLLYADEDRRRKMAGCLIETFNTGPLRSDFGKWRQVLPVRMIFEDLPDERNFVAFDESEPNEPLVHYEGHSDYTASAIARAEEDLARVMSPLPVEKIEMRPHPEPSEAHILGSTPMGDDPAVSIVDRNSIHHEVRNLMVLGSGTFPTGSPANPTLTLSALALRAGDNLLG